MKSQLCNIMWVLLSAVHIPQWKRHIIPVLKEKSHTFTHSKVWKRQSTLALVLHHPEVLLLQYYKQADELS